MPTCTIAEPARGGYRRYLSWAMACAPVLGGVPIAFFFTGLHGDYHQRTDEAEFIDYPHYVRITNYINDVMQEVANGPRPRINGTRPARPPRPVVP